MEYDADINALVDRFPVKLAAKLREKVVESLKSFARKVRAETARRITLEWEKKYSEKPVERRRLPDMRNGVTRRFELPRLPHVHECPHCNKVYEEKRQPLRLYVSTGNYEDGSLGELFIRCDRVGELTHGIFDELALCVSLAIQYGAPLSVFVEKFRHTRFGPGGYIKDPKYQQCSSVLDLLASWLEDTYLKKEGN